MWHELVHVKVTAAQALWEKAQSKSRLVSKYQFVYLPCLGCSPRLGGSRILCFMRCVCVNIYGVCEHQIMFPTIILFPSPSKFIFMNVAHELYSWEAILFSFGEWDVRYSGFIMFCCIYVLYFVLFWGRPFI